MERTVPLLDEGPLIDVSSSHPIYHDNNLMNGWLRAIDTTVSGKLAQQKANSLQLNTPVQIIPRLYLGTLRHAKELSLLSKLNITHLLDCSTSHLHDSLTSNEVPKSKTKSVDTQGMSLAKRSLLLSFDEDRQSTSPTSPSYTHISELSEGRKSVHFSKAVNHIDSILKQQGRTSNSILVFCLSGINRSAAVCAATLMAKESLTLLNALIRIRDATGPVIQMPGIQRQLLDYAIETSKLDDARQWPPEENDLDIEREMFEDWRSIASDELGPDDADYYDSDDHLSEAAEDGSVCHTHREFTRRTPDLLA